jgi:alpha-galactosidase
VSVYRGLRSQLVGTMPFWPFGMPQWGQEWTALGLRCDDDVTRYVSVWRCKGDEDTCRLPVRELGGREGVKVECLYPKKFPCRIF